MKNIVIINQPLNNRGDEAAHRSLMRALERELPKAHFTVLFFHANENDISEFIVNSPHIEYVNVDGFTKGVYFLQRWTLRLNLLFLSLLHPTIRKYANGIRKADIVICAMGGINMGGFQGWDHIFNLSLAKYYKKKLIYYSRSFGPFPVKTKWNRVFRKISYQLLNSFDFLSIRDYKTAELADVLKLKYIQSIDTAFLDNPKVEIPIDILKVINDEKYIVFVPNSLTWHPTYRNKRQEDVDNFFIEAMKVLLSKNNRIIMLPQLSQYVTYSEPDYEYFCKLKNRVNNDNIIVLHDTYSSDVQQKIIEKANFVIGARYHSIVFAINNSTPFISLSYEHKMTGLLELLSLSNRNIDILSIGEESFKEDEILKSIDKILDLPYEGIEPKIKARKMATDCFQQMIKMLKNE